MKERVDVAWVTRELNRNERELTRRPRNQTVANLGRVRWRAEESRALAWEPEGHVLIGSLFTSA